MTAKTLSEIAQLCGASLEGDGDRPITGPASLAEATASEISFLANPKYRAQLDSTRAGGVVVAEDVSCERADLPLLRCSDPNQAFSRVVSAFAAEEPTFPAGIHETAVVGEGCELGENVTLGAHCVVGAGTRIASGVTVGPGCVIGPACELGADTLLHARVTLYSGTRVGERCVLHSGAVIGAEGFGFDPSPEGWVKVPQCGHVILEDDVEIGANTTIDRARFGATVLRRGAKIDNLVQIGHNIVIGENALLAAQVGLAGSTKVGKWAVMGGKSGAAGHIEIGDGARVAGGAAVISDIPAGADFMGLAREAAQGGSQAPGRPRPRREAPGPRRLPRGAPLPAGRRRVMARRQRTLRTAIEFSGAGLHSGETINARVLPAAPGTGVEFVRTDLPDTPAIPAHVTYHSEKDRRTRLQRGESGVDTVEHFLAACAGAMVDNMTVELSGPEMPGMDGSALEFLKLFQQAGAVDQASDVRSFRLQEPVYVRDEDATLVRAPQRQGPPHPAVRRLVRRAGRRGRLLPVRADRRELRVADRVRAHVLHGLRGRGAACRRLRQGRDAREHRRARGPRDEDAHARRAGAAQAARPRRRPVPARRGPAGAHHRDAHRSQDEHQARPPPARPHAGRGDRRDHQARVGTRHPRDPAHAPAPLPVPADRPRGRDGRLPARGGDQERHDQRALLPGPLPQRAADARRPPARVDGAARRRAAAPQAREHGQARGALGDRQGQAAGRRLPRGPAAGSRSRRCECEDKLRP